ncbi:hypothetical protein HDU98_010037 [Podochytrium sp. JEL0797]|nr:hypothetical protein HDU98_010037 [Podochytrium sp. JEL0797]
MNQPEVAGGVEPPSGVQAQVTAFQRKFQALLDSTTPHWKERWIGTAILFVLYFVRVFWISAYYIVTYSLGIYLLNLFLAFLQPKFDPAMEQMEEGGAGEEDMALPTRNDDEFRPFIRRLPEFKFWYWATRGILIAFVCTLFPIFDVPVFWPILVFYFFILFGLTMKQRIKHMVKYNFNGYRLNLQFQTKVTALPANSQPAKYVPSSDKHHSLTEHKRLMAHSNFNVLSDSGLLFVDDTGFLNRLVVGTLEVAVERVCEVPVSKGERATCASVQMVGEDVAVVCDGEGRVAVIDLAERKVKFLAELFGEQECGNWFGAILASVCVWDGESVCVSVTQAAFANSGDKFRVSTFRVSQTGAVLVAQAEGGEAPRAVVQEAGGAVVVVFDSNRKPFKQTFPLSATVDSSPLPSMSPTPNQPGTPFDPSLPAVPVSMIPKPSALNLLDDAMESEEDESEDPASIHATGGASFLCIPGPNRPISLGSNSFLCLQTSSNKVCLKSSVDGILCTVTTVADSISIDHVATFDAFAYISASKRNRQYVFLGRNFAFAYIVENSRYLYAYRKPGEGKEGEGALGSDQWVVDLWEFRECQEGAVGRVRGVREFEKGKVAVVCEDCVVVVDLN